MRSSVLLALLPLLSTSLHARAGDVCTNEANDHITQVRCLGKELERLDAQLNEVYQQALASRPETDDSDSRKTREQLRKSQRAWLKYKEENCALLGGLQGGSNLWVTDFTARCEKDELEKRIEFLRWVANGAFRM